MSVVFRAPSFCAVFGAFVLLAASPRLAACWSFNGAPACTASGNQNNPLCVGDGAGGALLVWQDYRSGDNDLYAQHVLADGTLDPQWPVNGAPVCALQSAVRNPVMVPDGSGGAIVAWYDFRYTSGGPDIFAHHITPGGVDPGWPAQGVAVCVVPGTQESPAIATDGAGGAIVSWEDLRSGSFAVYAQHVTSGGAIDPAWPAGGRLLCVAPGNHKSPVVAEDGAGGAIVAWFDDRAGFSDVYAQHVLASGALDGGWPVSGLPVCTAPADQYVSAALPDGGGGAFVLWVDFRNSNYDVYAQHVLSSGSMSPSWPVNGAAVCSNPYHQQVPSAVRDGSGGAFVTWADSRGAATDTDYDIYASHLIASGVDPAWPVDGASLCAAPGRQWVPVITLDDGGGVIVAWEDLRAGAGSNDIYVQRVDASGAVVPGWPTDGAAVCTAVGIQRTPAIARDGVGGAILAWTDFRGVPNPSTTSDIYTQRVYPDGELGAVGTIPLRGLKVQDPRPNPTQGLVQLGYELPTGGSVRAEVFDLAGKRVRVLASPVDRSPGRHVLVWDARGDDGSRQRSGIYFIRIVMNGQSASRRVALVD